MSEVRGTQVNGRPRRGLLTYALWSVALVGVAAVLYVIVTAVAKPGGPPELKSLARGDMAKLEVSAKQGPPPSTPFLNPQGHAMTLADLKGQVLVVNLWATWCAPCVKEMPTLAGLQAAYAGRIKVVAISMDAAADREKARAFIANHAPLTFYQDTKLALPFALEPAVAGFPTTVIYGSDGRERARFPGDANWNGPDARRVIDAVLGGH